MKRVAVLRGGPSDEYQISMQTGAKVIDTLKDLNYSCKDVVITRKGEWLDNGFVKTPENALEAVDVVFVAMHGAYGEDGQVQRILERKKVPFTGSRSLCSAVAFNKDLAKRTLLPHDIKMAKHRRIKKEEVSDLSELVAELLSELGSELFVKTATGGSSIGTRYTRNEEMLTKALEELLESYEQILIEEFIRGREATVGVLEQFRNEDVYVLPPVEIVTSGNDPFFTYESKYNGTTEEIAPGRFSYSEKTKLSDIARKIHTELGCRQYSRSDFIIKDGEVYFLEVNTLPGLTENSLFPKATSAIGMTYPQLIMHLVETAS